MSGGKGFVDDKPADVLGTALKLAKIIKESPEDLDQGTVDLGNQLLAIFSNQEFGETPETQAFKKQIKTQKLEIIQQAIDDLAARGKILEKSYMGVFFNGKRSSTFIFSYGEVPQGEIIFSVEVVDPDMFARWRRGSNQEISDDNVNAAIYRLAVEWAKIL